MIRLIRNIALLAILATAGLAWFTRDTSGSVLPSTGTAVTSTAGVELHYSPSENLEHIDIGLINSSQGSLDIAMYAFTDQAIALAVVNAANRGVKVRIYRDLQQYQQEQARNATIATLFRGNRNIQIRVKNSRDLMHLKAFSNGALLRDGSANWSPSGEKRQNNTLIVLRDPGMVSAFTQQFNALWNRRDNYVVQ